MGFYFYGKVYGKWIRNLTIFFKWSYELGTISGLTLRLFFESKFLCSNGTMDRCTTVTEVPLKRTWFFKKIFVTNFGAILTALNRLKRKFQYR